MTTEGEDKIVMPVGDDIPVIVPKVDETPKVELTDEKVTLDNVDYTLDKEGNAVGSDNKIFKTKEELVALKAASESNSDDSEEEIKIDGILYKLDDKGNALKEDGSIFLTKEKIDELSGEEANTGITDIIKLTNISPVDEKGNKIEYESTPEGIATYINDVVSIQLDAERENIEKRFFQDNPALYDAYLYTLRNGSLDGYGGKTDWSTIDITKADDEVKESLIIADLRAQGNTEERSRYLVKLIKTDGKLTEEATAAQTSLVARDAAAETAALQIKANNEKDEQDRENAYWEAIDKAYKSGKFKVGEKEYSIPKAFRVKDESGKTLNLSDKDFIEYINKPKQWQIGDEVVTATAYQVDKYLKDQSRTPNDDLLDMLQSFVKYDNSQFIEEQISTRKVKSIVTTTSGSSKSKSITTKSDDQIKFVV